MPRAAFQRLIDPRGKNRQLPCHGFTWVCLAQWRTSIPTLRRGQDTRSTRSIKIKGSRWETTNTIFQLTD